MLIVMVNRRVILRFCRPVPKSFAHLHEDFQDLAEATTASTIDIRLSEYAGFRL